MASLFPQIGSWYRDTATGQRFEIVAIDEKQKTIEVQFYDGDISEFDIESWGSIQIVEVETPNDIYAGYEDMAALVDDNVFPLHSNPLDSIEPDSFNGFDDLSFH